MRTLMLLIVLAATRLLHAQASLTIDIALSEPDAGGKLMVAVCPSEEAYESEKGCILKEVAAKGAKARVVFLSLPPGQHAIKVFHDVNGNGQLDTNKLGIPNEPYGFGNDARGRFGPPSFEEAAVTLGQAPVVTALRLK